MGTFVLLYLFTVEYTFLLSKEFTSEPESPVDSISSSQTPMARMALSDRIQDVLSLLRRHRLSPFDLVLELLDDSKPQYVFYRTEFYKEENEKLSRILVAIISTDSGKRKLHTLIRQPPILDLFCDVITDEMNTVQKAELMPGIGAVTPEFIRNWTVSTHQGLVPCTQRILLAGAETSLAKEKIGKRTQRLYVVHLFENSLFKLFQTALQCFSKAAELSAFIPFGPFPQLPIHLWHLFMGYRLCTSNNRCVTQVRTVRFVLFSSQWSIQSCITVHRACH